MTLFNIDRNSGIGASEVPGIAGLSPYTTAVGVWMEKMGLGAPVQQTDAMTAGQRLERPILKLGAHFIGRRLLHNRQSFKHPLWPDVPLWATPDGFSDGREALAEVKLVGHRWSDWGDGPPPYVQLQVQAQLACLPRVERAYVIALLGSEVRTYTVEREPEVQHRLPVLVADWWASYIKTETAPDPMTDEDRWVLIRAALHAGASRSEPRLATPDEQMLGSELLRLLAQQDELARLVEDRRQELALVASDSDVKGLGWLARWSERRSVDWRSLATRAEIPEALVQEFSRATPVFTFRRDRQRGEA